MKKTVFTSRIFAAALAMLISVSMCGGSFIEALAFEAEEKVTNEVTASDEGTEGTENTEDSDNTKEAASAEGAAEEKASAEDGDTEKAADEGKEEAADGVAAEKEQAKEETASLNAQSLNLSTGQLANISVTASKDGAFVTVFWRKVAGAHHYKVYLDGAVKSPDIAASDNDANTLKFIIKDAPAAGAHTVKVEAYRVKSSEDTSGGDEGSGGNDQGGSSSETQPGTVEYEKFAEGSAQNIQTRMRGGLTSRTTAAGNTGLSLRTLLGESNGGYAVAQGAATDGTYAYYMMSSSDNQKGRIIKIRISDNAVVGTGPVLNTYHANGMTYDSKRNRLVCVAYGSRRQELTFVDPGSLTIIEHRDVSYTHTDMEGHRYGDNGIAAIAYVPEYDVYVTRERGKHVSGGVNDIMIFDAASLDMIGYVRTKVTSAYNGTYQSMDADEKYVYFLISPGGNVDGNIIVCLDWNSENLLPVKNGETKYIKNIWYANNDGSGTPDAVLTIPISHESEGLFHTTDPNTRAEHFYVSEYHGRWAYKTVTKKVVKSKKKWKKVRKWWHKKKKKWVSKKPKKKYRGRSKKVWKYKYKYKKVKVKVKDYWARDDYVYDLGII